jgi:hypothetical protein
VNVVYDAGALVAAERGDRDFWADHRVRLEQGVLPAVPAAVIAQVSRSTRQVPLRRLLRGCDPAVLGEHGAHRAGALLAAARTSDVVDATVVEAALARNAVIVTSDRSDVERLLGGATLPIVDV